VEVPLGDFVFLCPAVQQIGPPGPYGADTLPKQHPVIGDDSLEPLLVWIDGSESVVVTEDR
jgi:hypothetical protein